METIKDSFQRTIDYIRISVTDRCNFRCTYCMPDGSFVPMAHADILTYEEIERLCMLFAKCGIHSIRLTGGEPLVRKNIVSLVECLHRIDGITRIAMTTNGSLFGKYAAQLKDAGLDGVNISLDTRNPDRFYSITGVHALPAVLDAIDRAVEVGIPSVKVNCVPMRQVNEDEICAIAGLAKDKSIHVRFIEMMPIGNGSHQAGMQEAETRAHLERSYGALRQVTEKLGNGPAAYWRPEGFAGTIGFISAVSGRFCDTCNRLRLTSDGILKPCLQYASHVDLKKALRSGASDEALLDIIRQTILQKPECHRFGEVDEDGCVEELECRKMSGIGG